MASTAALPTAAQPEAKPKVTAAPSPPSAWEQRRRRALRAAARLAVAAAPIIAGVVGPRIFAPKTTQLLPFYQEHLGYALIPLVPILLCLIYMARNYRRTHPPRPARGRPAKPIQPPKPSLRQHIRDVSAIIGALDGIVWRVIYAAAFLAACVAAGKLMPLSVADVKAVADDPQNLRLVGKALAGPVLAYGLIHFRTSSIIRGRDGSIAALYAVARDTLGYPKTRPRTVTANQLDLLTPHRAIQVRDWASLTEPDTFFVMAPEGLSVSDTKSWDQYELNLNAKAPRPEEWRVIVDERGRGAFVCPANYPTRVLWDGEYHTDPLTFDLGVNLTSGKRQMLTLNDTTPGIAISGGTSSGKTSLAEIIAAQVLVKPMPWNPELHGMVVLVDPKGPLARRWRGRPGVVVADGNLDAAEPDDKGDPITGVMVMAACMQWLEIEHKRRAAVLARYPNAATWIHLPDDVRSEERFFPIFLIMDEYIDHTDKEKGDDPRIEAENDARDATTRMTNWIARKARNVGIHTCVIAQRVNMTLVGNVLMTNLPVRCITGTMDDTQTQTMFATTEVPSLPCTKRVTDETGEVMVKTIPGRARIMNAVGQEINRIQVSYFGGDSNSATLDKWLPRGLVPPNGDFSVPAGQPRSAADFDNEGNLIDSADDTTTDTGDAIEDLPMDGIEPSAADLLGDNPAETIAAWDDETDDEEDEDEEDEDYEEEDYEDDPDNLAAPPAGPRPVFPAADIAADRCGEPGCVDDADGRCGACGTARCATHLQTVGGSGYAANRPLCAPHAHDDVAVRSALGPALYRATFSLVDRHSLPAQAQITPERVRVTIRTPDQRRIVEITVADGVITAQSKGGTVTGAAEAKNRVTAAITGYLSSLDQATQGNPS